MKLCITASEKDLHAPVDSRFGRCPYFLLVDTETLKCEAVANPARTTGQGAGIRAAQVLTDHNIEALLTGVVGPNALEALQAAGIRVYEGVNPDITAREALDKFNQGKFAASSFSRLRAGCGPGAGKRGRQGGGWSRCQQ
jgi:predicted Fe-Mo cluster-binding NifX family protein